MDLHEKLVELHEKDVELHANSHVFVKKGWNCIKNDLVFVKMVG